MDGIAILTLAGTVAGFSLPTWWALSKIYYKLGEHSIKLENHNKRLNSIEKKLDKLNGNIKNGQ
ncbi:MAG: hypothetical protein ACTSUF_03665 [Candidatus Heimdallarchaeaceae archaeon]